MFECSQCNQFVTFIILIDSSVPQIDVQTDASEKEGKKLCRYYFDSFNGSMACLFFISINLLKYSHYILDF